jgi:hypothetical protein
MGLVGPRLGDFPVLAELTVEIAARRGQGEGAAGREDVKERFFLHRIHVDGAGVAIDERVIAAVHVLTHAAVSPFTRSHLAKSGTELTPNIAPGELGEKRRRLSAEEAFLQA